MIGNIRDNYRRFVKYSGAATGMRRVARVVNDAVGGSVKRSGSEGNERSVLGDGEIRGEVLVGGFKISRYRVGHMKLAVSLPVLLAPMIV